MHWKMIVTRQEILLIIRTKQRKKIVQLFHQKHVKHSNIKKFVSSFQFFLCVVFVLILILIVFFFVNEIVEIDFSSILMIIQSKLMKIKSHHLNLINIHRYSFLFLLFLFYLSFIHFIVSLNNGIE